MEKAFWQKLEEMAREIKQRDDFIVVGHHDADGITATAIACQALKRENKKYCFKIVKQLYPETIEEIKGAAKNVIFVDFGSNMLDKLSQEFPENSFVLDHHQPLDVEFKFHCNPCNYGFSGSNEISGAGVTYFLAKAMRKENQDLAPLAVVGAVGDMQDLSGRLTGLNKTILADAVEKNLMLKENDLRLYGRISRPLTSYLFFASSPLLPELTAQEENCRKFLEGAGIKLKEGEHWRAYNDLSPQEKKNLTTALILHLQSFNVPEWKLQELVGEVYTLLEEEKHSPLRDAKEFATLLNACGRHGQPDLALEVCMGDRAEKYAEALQLVLTHRRMLRQGIEFMTEKGVEEFESFYFFDAGHEIKDSLVGIIAGMLYGSGVIQPTKPIIAFAHYEENVVKVSARASRQLTRQGLNLGKSLANVCNSLGGLAQAGGHVCAAGCRISEDQKDVFLEKLNQEIKSSLTRKS